VIKIYYMYWTYYLPKRIHVLVVIVYPTVQDTLLDTTPNGEGERNASTSTTIVLHTSMLVLPSTITLFFLVPYSTSYTLGLLLQLLRYYTIRMHLWVCQYVRWKQRYLLCAVAHCSTGMYVSVWTEQSTNFLQYSFCMMSYRIGTVA
jgi:hypothetical protein